MIPKNGTIGDLKIGLQKKAKIDDEIIRKIRIIESSSGKICRELPPEQSVTAMSDFVNLYAEVIPEEERNPEDSDTIINCYHFDKEPNKPHSVPFKFIVKQVGPKISKVLGPPLTKLGRALSRDEEATISANRHQRQTI